MNKHGGNWASPAWRRDYWGLLTGEEFTLTEWWSWKKQTQTLPEADKDRTWVTDNMLQDGTFQLGMKKFLP